MKGGNFWITVVEVFFLFKIFIPKIKYNIIFKQISTGKKLLTFPSRNHYYSGSRPVTFLTFPSYEPSSKLSSWAAHVSLFRGLIPSRADTFELVLFLRKDQTITKNSFGFSFEQRKIVEKVKKSFGYNYYLMGANLTFES